MNKKFSLKTLLIAIFAICVLSAWVNYQRSRNSDKLLKLLDSINANVTLSNTPPDKGLFSKLVANTSMRPEELDLRKLNQFQAKHLSVSLAVNEIKILRFIRVDLPDECPLFFDSDKTWESLDQVIFRDTPVPQSWINKISKLPHVRRIVVSGAKCNLEPEQLTDSKTIEEVVLSQRGISANRLLSLNDESKNATVKLIGGYDTKWKLGKGEDTLSLSESDPIANQKMKLAIVAIQNSLQKLGAKNRLPLNPASQSDILRLEEITGTPLPKSLRAFYEVTDGWSEKESPMLWGIRSAKDAATEYRNRCDYWEEENAYMSYDFEPFNYDAFDNPNAIPLGFSVGICIWQDRLCDVDEDGEAGPRNAKSSDLLECLLKVNEELQTDPEFPTYDWRDERIRIDDFWFE